MNAAELQLMLANRHALDVYVSECKDGPTQTRAHLRLDAWVLLRTWSPITAIGYEIKVDRADWRRDEKLHNYMPLCHLLYIVAPKGIVPVDELPAGVGLLEPVGTAGRLQMKRKAARREITLPAELMVYVLMCRTKITRERQDFATGDRHWRTEELREWVAGKRERQTLSYAVSQKIQDTFNQQQRAIAEQTRRNDELEKVRDRIAELGFDIAQPIQSWRVREKLDALNRTVDTWTLREIRQTATKLTSIAESLERLKDGSVESEEVA